MGETLWGRRVHVWRPLASPYRVRQWLPRRESFVQVRRGDFLLLLHWLPHMGGLCLRSEVRLSDPRATHAFTPWRYRRLTVKRREKLGLVGVPPNAAASASVILAKLPAVRAWVSDTSYDDKSVRVPGALRISSRDAMWCLTLTDPDAGARLLVTDSSLDKALLLLEQLCGVEDAPWQIDPYAPQKKGKK